MMRHLLDTDDLTPAELASVLDHAERPVLPRLLEGRGVALLFEKPSLRTRHSAELAVVQLGGHPISMRGDEIGAGKREPLADIARVLAGYHAVIGARVFEHRQLTELASVDALPVVNLLSDRAHPCQTLADLLTMRQEWGSLAGRTVAWVGDFNNVARSLALGAAMSGMAVRIAAPAGYGPTGDDLARLAGLGCVPVVTVDPVAAASGADAVHTDVFTSMGQEAETAERNAAFAGFQVTAAVMAAAAPDAVFMHCLPAHRGEEVAAEVVDGPRSRIIPQAHNRMHAFRGLLWWLVEHSMAEDG
jgi:ornithine carbamoyltransferase